MDVSHWPGLSLRPIISDDLPVRREIYAGTREDELQQTGWPPGQKAAFLRQPTDLNVIDIALLPAHRGRGLGTFLLRELLAEADREGRTVSLHVEFFNRVRSLYDRERLRQTIRYHAKSPGRAFAGDGTSKQALATGELRRLADEWVGPAYRRLEALRPDRKRQAG